MNRITLVNLYLIILNLILRTVKINYKYEYYLKFKVEEIIKLQFLLTFCSHEPTNQASNQFSYL